jgi:hypothetical protein
MMKQPCSRAVAALHPPFRVMVVDLSLARVVPDRATYAPHASYPGPPKTDVHAESSAGAAVPAVVERLCNPWGPVARKNLRNRVRCVHWVSCLPLMRQLNRTPAVTAAE